MADSITVVLRDPTTGVGLSGQLVTLRISPFSATLYTLTDIVGKPGAYKYDGDYATAKYKLYVNGTEDTSFGGTNGKYLISDDILLLSGGTMTGDIDMGGNRLKEVGDATDGDDAVNLDQANAAYLAKAGGTMSGDIDMANNRITDLPAPADDGDAARKIDYEDADAVVAAAAAAASALKANLSGGNTFEGNQIFENDVNFAEDPPTCGNDPVGDDSLTRKAWVVAQVTAVAVTPYQNSPNNLRLIPGGVQETNKVYTTWALAQNVARLYPAGNTHRIQIDIEGAGSGGTSIAVSNGAISGNSAFNSFVSVKGANRNIVLTVDDDSFNVSAGGTVISNVTLSRDDSGSGTPSFANFIFDNVDFDFDVADLSFNGCKFKGVCNIKNTGGTVSFTSVAGGYVICSDAIPATLRGEGNVPVADF